MRQRMTEDTPPPHRKVAAALSAAVTTTPKQENAPTSHGRANPKEESSLFPAALRKRGAGGEALLSEKRPLPQSSPKRSSSEGGPGEGKDSHSRQWRLSMAVFLNRNKRP